MKNLAITIFLGVALLPLGASAKIGFQLEDQKQRQHTARSIFATKLPVVFIGGDQRKTKDAIKAWLSPLRKALGQSALVIGYVDLRRVPFFIPNSILRRGINKSLPTLTVLCDYKGRYAKALGFASETLVAIRVFDPKGGLRGAVEGRYTKARLEALRSALGQR